MRLLFGRDQTDRFAIGRPVDTPNHLLDNTPALVFEKSHIYEKKSYLFAINIKCQGIDF